MCIRIFKKKNLLFDDRFTNDNVYGNYDEYLRLYLALHLKLLLPEDQTAFYLFPIIVGLLIGWKFGSIIKAPATLNGIYNGTIGGVMGTMLGAVLKNPAYATSQSSQKH